MLEQLLAYSTSCLAYLFSEKTSQVRRRISFGKIVAESLQVEREGGSGSGCASLQCAPFHLLAVHRERDPMQECSRTRRGDSGESSP
jgi:hypothetical protein